MFHELWKRDELKIAFGNGLYSDYILGLILTAASSIFINRVMLVQESAELGKIY